MVFVCTKGKCCEMLKERKLVRLPKHLNFNWLNYQLSPDSRYE